MSSNLYIGIDVGKKWDVGTLLSEALLGKHKRYESCPTVRIENSRAGFERLLDTLRTHAPRVRAPLKHCRVLMERTGHYAYPLEQFLHDHDIPVYRITPKKRYSKNKNDVVDARALAVILFNQLELKTPVVDKDWLIQRLHPLSPAAAYLRGLVQHRFERQQGCTRCKNKLTAICDQLFPELVQVLKNPNSVSALSVRLAFPTAQSVASATLQELYAVRVWTSPGNAQFAKLQELAATSIGIKDTNQQRSLILQQSQLVDELHLYERQLIEADKEIEAVLKDSREGQILLSFTGIGPTHASTILATIGSIANFESAAKLRSYVGWSPQQSQTGTSFDSTRLTKAGNRALKPAMRFIAFTAIKHDKRWRELHDRLVPIKCGTIDKKTGKPRGLMKVVGRIAGDITGVIWFLLRKDYDLLQSLPRGAVAPPPELYQPGRK